jgi:excisionase family DNA binding protein
MPRKVKIPTDNSGSSSKDNMLNSSKFFDILNERFPNKLHFSISEVAIVLNLSYDFVREKIASGCISANKFGDRYMINVFELGRILTEGVK